VKEKRTLTQNDAVIFNIQRYSIHDGPGCRTLVFLKGCPLGCVWCSNPESQSGMIQLYFNRVKCIGCGTCFEVCPEAAIKPGNSADQIDWSKCTNCGICASQCPPHALEMKGQRMSIQQVMDEVMKDWLFYKNSGGGITLGGGEPMMQIDFVTKLLKLCKDKQIHTVIETCGYAEWSDFEQIADYVDLFFYDIKLMDSIQHKQCTGKDNIKILNNLRQLASIKNNIQIRVPIIPHFNDSDENIRNIAEFAASIGINQVELLPYHRYGESKYEAIGRSYTLKDIVSPNVSRMDQLQQILVDSCIIKRK
jgi:pyruvate formate lyase activating enzyme